MNESLLTVPAGVGHVAPTNYDWIGFTFVRPLQRNAGKPGATGLTMFDGLGNSSTKLTNGYVDGEQRGFVHMQNSYDEMFKEVNHANGEASFRYYGFMNNNSYYYFMNWEMYNNTANLYAGPLRGFNCKICVGNNDGYTSHGCSHNWGDYTQINKVFGLFRHRNGTYKVWELKNLINDGAYTNTLIKSKSYPLKNISPTTTNSQIGKGPVQCGTYRQAGFGVPWTVTNNTLMNYRFCGFSISVCISNKADSKRCHTFKINEITPMPVGVNPNGDELGELVLYKHHVHYSTDMRDREFQLRYK